MSTNLVYSAEETPRIMLLKSCAWPSFFFLAFPTVSPLICQTVFFSQTIHTWPPQTSTIMLTSIYIISLKSPYSYLIYWRWQLCITWMCSYGLLNIYYLLTSKMALNSPPHKYIFSHFRNAYYYFIDFVPKHHKRGIVFSVLFWGHARYSQISVKHIIY